MRITDIILENDEPVRIDVANEVAEKLFMTDGNGNPIIGQFIPGYAGMNYQNIVALAKTAALKNPRRERKAIDDLVDAEIKKHLKKVKEPAPAQTAPKKATEPKKATAVPKAKPDTAPESPGTDKDLGIELKGKMGDLQQFVGKSVRRGTKFADKFTKGV